MAAINTRVTRAQRRVGLTGKPLPYGNLLETLPGPGDKKVELNVASVPVQRDLSIQQSEEDINRPPEGSSDEQSLPSSNSDDEFADHERPKKKIKVHADNRCNENGSRETASPQLPVVPSSMPATTFHRTGRKSLNDIGQCRSSQGPVKEKDDGNDDLQRIRAMARQSETRRSYGSQTYNIHTVAHGKENKPPRLHRDLKRPFHSDLAPKPEGAHRAKKTSRAGGFKKPLSLSNSPRKGRPSQPQFNQPLQSKSSPRSSPKSSPFAFKQPPTLATDHNQSGRKEQDLILQKPPIMTHHVGSHDADLPDSSFSQRAHTPLFDSDDKERSSPISFLSASPPRPDSVNPNEITYFTPAKVCPMCNAPVDVLLMEEYLPATRPTVRQQTRFCKAHRLRDAHEAWLKNGYPKDLDWSKFNARLRRHHPDIKAILNKQRPSFYRDAFAKHIASGQNRTLRQCLAQETDIEGLSSGYYGSKGTKLITQNILNTFSPMLRRLAATDKLIADGGVSGYIQAVLAPEMAVVLVQEDMGVDGERAREILRESEGIGNLVNEEEDEVVLGGDDEEEEG